MKVKSISHLAYKITDMDASLRFYCDVLGFKKKFSLTFGDLMQLIEERYKNQATTVSKDNNEEQYVARIKYFAQRKDEVWLIYLEISPNNFIELFPAEPGLPSAICDDNHIGYTHLSLEVEDIKEAYDRMVAAGVNITSEVTLGIDFTYQFWLTDPDGNRIEMMQYTDRSMQLYGK